MKLKTLRKGMGHALMIGAIMVALTATEARSDTTSVFVSGKSSLYNDWLFPAGGNTFDATPVPGLEACNGGSVSIVAAGCAIDAGSRCTDANGLSSNFRGLRVYSLIGAWSTSPTQMTAAAAASSAFFIGRSNTIFAPAGAGPYYLFMGDNDGIFRDNGRGYTVSLTWSDSCITDADGDGVADGEDNCPDVPNADQGDNDNDGVGDLCDLCLGDDDSGDTDADFVCDNTDNCPGDANTDQADADSDGIGDVCEADTDEDGTIDDLDNCPLDFNPDQGDSDGDSLGDVCDPDDDNDGVTDDIDNCPLIPNLGQDDFDGDGQGDACDGDDDGDFVLDEDDLCPRTPLDVPINDDGCSGTQLVGLACSDYDPCGFRNHGQYVKCITHAANAARDADLLTNRERAAVVRAAAHTHCE